MAEGTLAYVFWHWKRPRIEEEEYEDRQRAFHRALSGSRPPGFRASSSVAVSGAEWAAGGHDAYEDWYLVDGFAALGDLNEAAVSGRRAGPHDAAAAVADGGAGGIYGLRGGEPLRKPTRAYWCTKPEGISYRDLLGELRPPVEEAGGALWLRQMVLGPAPELCVQAPGAVSLPDELDATVLSLRPVWPDDGG